MATDILQARLERYRPKSYQELLNAMKEISQELALAALSSAGFFKKAAFQEGTCLRIMHGIRRYSEDLDFILLEPNPSFQWQSYLEQMRLEFESFDLHLTVQDRSKADHIVKKAFIKEDSFGKILDLRPSRGPADIQKIRIKLEIDTRPPAGSTFTTHVLDFPYPASVTNQDLPSLFAGKCHALLCRSFVEGRDWYDFLWYVANQTPVNTDHLQQALYQTGPWQGENVTVDSAWLSSALDRRIEEIDWGAITADVRPFLKPPELSSLNLWTRSFFHSRVKELYSYF